MITKNGLDKAHALLGEAFKGDYTARGVIKQIVTSGSVEGASLSEAYTSADLNAAFSVSVKQTLESNYEEAPRVWTKVAQRKVVPDFKPIHFREFDWDRGLQVEENAGIKVPVGSLATIPELTEYPTFGFSTAQNAFAIDKKGARVPFSWEMVINDEWDVIKGIPGNMLRLALNTEETSVFSVLANNLGPNGELFTGQLAPDNVPLSLDNLKAAKQKIRNRVSAIGDRKRRVRVPKFALVVSTALEDQAREILGVSSYKQTVKNGDTEREITFNTANSDVELVVADVLSDIDLSGKSASTWYLVPLNGTDGTKTSLFNGFLENHERPEFRSSGTGGLYLGGGIVPSLEGSLLNDDIEYRVRHVNKGGFLHAEGMYASVGA